MAMNEIGYLYNYGVGVPGDYEEARRWYDQAVELGNSAAMANIGRSYAMGRRAP